MTEQVSFVCLNSFTLSRTVWLQWCTVRRALFGAVVRHRHTRRALARLQLGRHFYTSFAMPPSLHLPPQGTRRVIRIIVTCTYAWIRPILVQAGIEFLEQAQVSLVGWAARCILFPSHFGPADIL